MKMWITMSLANAPVKLWESEEMLGGDFENLSLPEKLMLWGFVLIAIGFFTLCVVFI